MRRDPATIFAAHVLDPDRCDLFVEGSEDRQFLELLVSGAKHPKAAIFEIAWVDLPDVGGNRERVLAFAEMAMAESATIRCLVDTDFDRLLGGSVPGNTWRTDYRDLEAYLLRPECTERIWRLGLNQPVAADAVLNAVLVAARPIGLLRLLSRKEGLDLPFQRTSLRSRVAATKESVAVDLKSLLRALLHNAERSLSELDEILERLDQLDSEDPQPACDIPHGKDCVDLLTEVLSAHGVNRADAPRLIRLGFERWMADEESVLREIVEWLKSCSAPAPPP